MTLPIYQRHGYGRFLIEFSYLLSRKEGMAGTPEKPLSDLGRLSYQSYWRSSLLEKIKNRQVVSVENLSKSTGMNVHDIAEVFQHNSMLNFTQSENKKFVYQIRYDKSLLSALEKRKLRVNEEGLRWTPLVASSSSQLDQESQIVPMESGPVSASKVVKEVTETVEEDSNLLTPSASLKKKRKRKWNKTGYNGVKKRKKSVKNSKESTEDSHDRNLSSCEQSRDSVIVETFNPETPKSKENIPISHISQQKEGSVTEDEAETNENVEENDRVKVDQVPDIDREETDVTLPDSIAAEDSKSEADKTNETVERKVIDNDNNNDIENIDGATGTNKIDNDTIDEQKTAIPKKHRWTKAHQSETVEDNIREKDDSDQTKQVVALTEKELENQRDLEEMQRLEEQRAQSKRSLEEANALKSSQATSKQPITHQNNTPKDIVKPPTSINKTPMHQQPIRSSPPTPQGNSCAQSPHPQHPSPVPAPSSHTRHIVPASPVTMRQTPSHTPSPSQTLQAHPSPYSQPTTPQQFQPSPQSMLSSPQPNSPMTPQPAPSRRSQAPPSHAPTHPPLYQQPNILPQAQPPQFQHSSVNVAQPSTIAKLQQMTNGIEQPGPVHGPHVPALLPQHAMASQQQVGTHHAPGQSRSHYNKHHQNHTPSQINNQPPHVAGHSHAWSQQQMSQHYAQYFVNGQNSRQPPMAFFPGPMHAAAANQQMYANATNNLLQNPYVAPPGAHGYPPPLSQHPPQQGQQHGQSYQNYPSYPSYAAPQGTFHPGMARTPR